MSALRPRQYQEQSPGGLSADEVREIVKQVLRNRREWAYPGDPRGKGVQIGGAPTIGFVKGTVSIIITPCIVSGGITTYGSGAFQLVYTANVDATGPTLDSDLASVPILNWYQNTGPIAVGINIFAVAIDYAYWFLTADCPTPTS